MAQGVSVSHVGICISDMQRSARFYTGALGFVEEYYLDVGPPGDACDVLTELPELSCRVGFFRQDGIRIELCTYEHPDVVGPAERRPMNQLGLTHLSLIVEDIAAVTARIVECGGRVYPQTRITTPKGDMIFCTDPDGIRIELWERIA
jgi:catechol 2,3-dioxygenase-like lactoylglutathione lyase family enzyme